MDLAGLIYTFHKGSLLLSLVMETEAKHITVANREIIVMASNCDVSGQDTSTRSLKRERHCKRLVINVHTDSIELVAQGPLSSG